MRQVVTMSWWAFMPKICRIGFIAALMAAGLLSTACARNEKKGLEARLGSSPYGGDVGRYGRDGRGNYAPGSEQEFKANGDDTIYFSSDSSELTTEARQSLEGQAKWLRRYPDRTITIEGHADERGTREYNIALGARRAAAVKSFLVSQGIGSATIRTTSYGKERPIAVCNDISCWSKNRRAQTVLTAAAVGARN